MDYTKHLEAWTSVLLNDFLRYFVFAGIAYLIFWVLGRKTWNHLFIQRVYPKAKKLWTEFKYSMSTVFIFSINGFIIHTLATNGHTRIYHDIGQHGLWWFLLSGMVMILFHDFYFYWSHRFMHLKAVYKHVHKVHHLSTNPSPWAAHSFHPLEALIQTVPFNIMVMTLPLHPAVIAFFMIHMIVRDVMGHLGYEFFPKGFLKSKWFNWLTSTTHHNLHHKNFHSNYGLYFSWWDNWMGTTDKAYESTFHEVTHRIKSVDSTELKASSKKIALTVLVALCSGTSVAQTAHGHWLTRDESTGEALAIVEITETKQGLEGHVSKIILQPYQTLDPICMRCPAPKKGQKVIGMEFMDDFVQHGSEWINGEIMDPQNGETYKSKMWLEKPHTLKVRGYGGPFNLFYRTQTWVKADSTKPGIHGLWKTIDDRTNHIRSLVLLKTQHGRLTGAIQQLFYLPDEGPDPVCFECDGALHGARIVGMKILWGFSLDGNQWTKGKLMDPANGKTYEGSIWLLDENRLKVRGYWGPFFRTQIWERVSPQDSLITQTRK